MSQSLALGDGSDELHLAVKDPRARRAWEDFAETNSLGNPQRTETSGHCALAASRSPPVQHVSLELRLKLRAGVAARLRQRTSSLSPFHDVVPNVVPTQAHLMEYAARLESKVLNPALGSSCASSFLDISAVQCLADVENRPMAVIVPLPARKEVLFGSKGLRIAVKAGIGQYFMAWILHPNQVPQQLGRPSSAWRGLMDVGRQLSKCLAKNPQASVMFYSFFHFRGDRKDKFDLLAII